MSRSLPRTFKACCTACLFAWVMCFTEGAIAQEARFTILKGEDVVGSIFASRKKSGDRTHYLMTSYSEFDVIWKQVVRSLTSAEYIGNALFGCHTNFSVNGALRDSSHLRPVEDAVHGFVHPDHRFVHSGAVAWTTARMYFEEPVGQLSIFVESLLAHCPLERTGPGTYRLTLSNNKVNHYSYRNGILHEIRVDRSLFDLVFRRVIS